MAYNFVPVEREQSFLMPPSIQEWLPADHLAWFILDLVESFDLSAFYVGRREDGWGRAAYDPKMMVAVLLYAYANGVRSSRGVERRLVEDVAFRVIAANNCPDHATIGRFRQAYGDALNGLFVQVLAVCVKADLVDVTVVAVDGTKIEANASRSKNLTEKQLELIAREVLEDAQRIDEEEDRLYGDRRGDELPPHLVDRQQRLEWIKDQLEQIKTEREESGKGRSEPRVNMTDPDSRTMKAANGYIQGYNAQAVVAKNQIVVAGELSNCAADAPLFKPMLDAAADNLEKAEGSSIGIGLADTGFLSRNNVEVDLPCDEVLIAPTRSDRLAELTTADCDEIEAQQAAREQWFQERARETQRRLNVLSDLIAEKITLADAAEQLGMSIPGVWHIKWRYLERGPEAVAPKHRKPPKELTAKQLMTLKFADDEAKKTYALRSVTIEPVFGQIKWVKGLTRFMRHGLDACKVEWMLQLTVHNLLKLWRSGLSLTPSPVCAA